MFKSPIYLPPYIAIYPYTELLFLPNFFHRIPITAINHTDFGIDGILNKCKRSYNKWDYITIQIFLPNIFFDMSFLFTEN